MATLRCQGATYGLGNGSHIGNKYTDTYTNYQYYSQQPQRLRTSTSESSIASTTSYYGDTSLRSSSVERKQSTPRQRKQLTQQQRRRARSLSSDNESYYYCFENNRSFYGGNSHKRQRSQRSPYANQRKLRRQQYEQQRYAYIFSSDSDSDNSLFFDNNHQEELSHQSSAVLKHSAGDSLAGNVNDGIVMENSQGFSWCCNQLILPNAALTDSAQSECLKAPAATALPKPPPHWLLRTASSRRAITHNSIPLAANAKNYDCHMVMYPKPDIVNDIDTYLLKLLLKLPP